MEIMEIFGAFATIIGLVIGIVQLYKWLKKPKESVRYDQHQKSDRLLILVTSAPQVNQGELAQMLHQIRVNIIISHRKP